MAKKRMKGANNIALTESQNASLGFINKQFAEHPTLGLTPRRLHQILTGAEQGHLQAQTDLFCDMEERDAHLFSEMSKRKRALLTVPWNVKPPKNASAAEKALALEVNDWLESISDFEDVILDALDAIGHGYSAQEISWENVDGLWLPSSIDYVPPRHFMFPTLMSGLPHNELRLRDLTVDGAALWPFGWFVHFHKAKSGYVERAGLHRVLAWPYLFKNYAIRDLAELLEIYGIPMRLGKYHNGATDDEKMTLLRAVSNIGHNAAGIIPQSMSIEFEKAAEGNAHPYEAMIKWCELSTSKAILGGTLTTQADGKTSTNALGNVHNEVRKELLLSDAKQLASSINANLIAALMQLNKPDIDPRRYPRFEFDLTEPEDMKLFSEALPNLVDMGMQITVSWAHDKLGIPLPESEKDSVLQRINTAAAASSNPMNTAANNFQVAALSTQTADLAKETLPKETLSKEALPTVDVTTVLPAEHVAMAAQTAIDDAIDGKLEKPTLQSAAEDMILPVLTALSRTGGYDDALSLLSNLAPDMDDTALRDELEQLQFAANAYGRITTLNARKIKTDA